MLWGLKPWEHDPENPQQIPPGIEMAVGGGRALPVAPATRVAAGVAVAGPKLVVAAAQEASSDASPRPAPAPTGVAPAQAIVVAEAPSSPASPAPPGAGAGEEAPSAGATTGEAPSEGASSPVATPAGTSGGSTGGPVTAGVTPGFESCEGDEYLLKITFLDEESSVEEAPVAIVLERIGADGSSDTIELEGDLEDARSLVLHLSSEGDCVHLEVVAPEEEGILSDGTSQAVVPAEGIPSSSAAPASP